MVLFHGNFIIGQWYGVKPFAGVLAAGFSGIYLFFTLSGFIILHAHVGDVGTPQRYFHYLSRRFIRIYPLYWLLFLVWGGWRIFAGRFEIENFLLNAFLFSTTGSKTTLTVAWSLLYEIIFYGLFSLAVLDKRLGIAVFLAWLSAILLNQVRTLSPFPALNPLSLLFFFGLGAGVFSLWARRLPCGLRSRLGTLGLILGTAAFLAAMIYRPGQIPAFGLASSLLLLAPLSPGIENFLKRRRFLNLLGNASYSIYLMHLQIQKIVFNNIKPFFDTHGSQSPAAANTLLILIVLASILAGIIVHRLVESPMLNFLKQRLSARRRAASIASTTP